ncbi:MAG: hypothetical protein ACLGH0_00355 [Thermoanaerobaculia bacterium]
MRAGFGKASKSDSASRELADAARPHSEEGSAALAIVDTALGRATGEEVFELIAAVERDTEKSGTNVTLLYADVLERGGYPRIAAEVRQRVLEWIDNVDHENVPIAVAADAEPLRAEIRRSLASLRARAVLPESDAKLLPVLRNVLRVERDGNDVIALGVSQQLDRIGEVGRGGYWIARSRDGGNSWQTYYTGLRERRPYVAVAEARLPLLDGDRLRIEVDVEESSSRGAIW